jgi:hypothetical protein
MVVIGYGILQYWDIAKQFLAAFSLVAIILLFVWAWESGDD